MTFVLVPTVELLLGRTNLGRLLGFGTHLGLFQGLNSSPRNELYISKQILMQKKVPAEEREFASI